MGWWELTCRPAGPHPCCYRSEGPNPLMKAHRRLGFHHKHLSPLGPSAEGGWRLGEVVGRTWGRPEARLQNVPQNGHSSIKKPPRSFHI